MLKEFRDFVARGNVKDLPVADLMGAASRLNDTTQ